MQVVGRTASTAVAMTAAGGALSVASQATGVTIGGCLGVSAYDGGGSTGSLCYAATPSGQSGFTVTAGVGVGSPSVGFSIGPFVSNGHRLTDQGGRFQAADASAGRGLLASGGGSVAWGRNQCSDPIWDAGVAWTPSISPFLVSAHYAVTDTWTFPSW